jgi:soluble lytic murein transglycosylase-like protein
VQRFEADLTPARPRVEASATAPDASAPGSKLGTPKLDTRKLDARELQQLINATGDRHNIDPDFISSVIHAESDFNPHAVSHKGAQGLMQLMPQTASQLGVDNAFDAGANLEGGTRYLRELLERYNFDVVKALAAYNAGPNRVDRYHGVPPYYETQAYIARIIRDFNRKKLAEQRAAKAAHASASSSRAPSKARTTKPKGSAPGAASAALAAQADRQKQAGSN